MTNARSISSGTSRDQGLRGWAYVTDGCDASDAHKVIECGAVKSLEVQTD